MIKSSSSLVLLFASLLTILLFFVTLSSSSSSSVVVSASSSAELATTSQVLCVCRCCFHNDCTYVQNASWQLDDCTECNAARCQEMIMSTQTRERISKTFDILVNLEQIVTADDDADRRVMVQHTLESLNENKWDVCEVTAMVETVTCQAAGTTAACQSSADLSAVCFDRNAPVVKYGTWFFLVTIIFGVVFAFLKNHLIGCQEFNQGSFDY